MRLPATRNRTLLCLNILLFAFLVSTVLMLSGRLDFGGAAYAFRQSYRAGDGGLLGERAVRAPDRQGLSAPSHFCFFSPVGRSPFHTRNAGTRAVNGAAAKSVSVYLGDDFWLECDTLRPVRYNS